MQITELKERALVYAIILIICILVCALLTVGGIVAYWLWPNSGYVIGAGCVLAVTVIVSLKLW